MATTVLAPPAAWARRHPRLGSAAAAAALLVVGFFALVPVVRFERPLSTVLFARDGGLLSATTASDGQWRFPPRAEVPPKFALALIQYEDKRFAWHPGVDPIAIVRASLSNLGAGRVVSGASTLTMQVVRLSRTGEPRSYAEKLIEALLALRLEAARSKEEILAAYASQAPFGGNVVGLDAAAWRYFGVPPERLSWAESATLAVLPNSPALVHPGRNRETLLSRRNRLLDLLREAEIIDPLTGDLAKAEPLPPEPKPIPQQALHLMGRLGRGQAAPVYTTLDANLQSRVQQIVERHHETLSANHIANAAALVLDVETGEVLAYVGNLLDADAATHAGHVDCVIAPRSTGSILKPLLYAAALDAGELLPTELVEDTPMRIGGFAPENYSRTFAGAVPAATALARSLNVPAARMLRDYGAGRLCALLKRCGMTTLTRPAEDYGLTLILGGAEGSLWEITGIYASLARLTNRAARGEPTAASFFPPRFELLPRPSTNGAKGSSAVPPIGPGAAFVTLQAMLEVARPGDEASWRDFAAPRQVAWKTGTSYGFRDGWAVGVTSRYAVGVWVGNADGEGRPGLTGFGTAAPILFDIFAALPASTWFRPPMSDLAAITICRHSGARAGPHCTDTEMIQAPRASLRGPVCPFCQTIHLDPSGRFRVHGDCEPVHRIRAVDRFVLPPVMEWFYRMRHAEYEALPPWRSDCIGKLGANAAPSLSIVYPRGNEGIYVPLELDGRRGRTVFEAAHRDPDATLYWHIDDQYAGITHDLHQLAVAPSPGAHVLTVVDQNGERAVERFVVLEKAGQ